MPARTACCSAFQPLHAAVSRQFRDKPWRKWGGHTRSHTIDRFKNRASELNTPTQSNINKERVHFCCAMINHPTQSKTNTPIRKRVSQRYSSHGLSQVSERSPIWLPSTSPSFLPSSPSVFLWLSSSLLCHLPLSQAHLPSSACFSLFVHLKSL